MKGCAHRKKEATYSEVNLNNKVRCDKVGGYGVSSIFDTCLTRYMQLTTFSKSHSTLWHSK